MRSGSQLDRSTRDMAKDRGRILVSFAIVFACVAITVAILALFGMRREYAAGERDWSEIVQWGMLPVVFYLPLVLLIGLCAALVVGLVGIHLRSGLGGPHDPSIRSPARAHSDPIVSSSPRRDSEE